jgi:hypothetical protein
MEARSTNTIGFVHYGGDVVAGVNDGIAVHLRSASTGSTAVIEPLSDSSTAGLKIRAKGAATLTLGNTSNAVSLAGSLFTLTGAVTAVSTAVTLTSTRVLIGTGSTSGISLIQQWKVEFNPPDLAATTSAISTITCAGLTTNAHIIITPRVPIDVLYSYQPYCSSANELKVQWYNASASSNSDSTNTAYVIAIMP